MLPTTSMRTGDTGRTKAPIKANEEKMAAAVKKAQPLAETMASVTKLLTGLVVSVSAHSLADTSLGILADIDRDAPRLSADIERLGLDHRELPGLTADLRHRALQLQADIENLINRLDEHERLAQHLVYEAYATDLGGDG